MFPNLKNWGYILLKLKFFLCVSDEAIIQYYWQDINQPLRTCIPCQWISCSANEINFVTLGKGSDLKDFKVVFIDIYARGQISCYLPVS